MRVEHARPSRSQAGHLARVKENEALKAAAKKSGVPAPASALKRSAKGPRDGFKLDIGSTFEQKVHLLTPVPFVFKPMTQPYLVK